MSDSPKSPQDAKAERAARLAAELRANLRRRKTQARGRAEDARNEGEASQEAPAPTDCGDRDA